MRSLLMFLYLTQVRSLEIISTKSGQIQGQTITASNGKALRTYFGIPFAKPPIGNLRFKTPEPVEPWEGVLQAKEKSVDCFQKDFSDVLLLFPYLKYVIPRAPFDEDCLKLNIWVPADVTSGPLPVMIYFYGGAFTFGGTERPIYDAKVLASEGDVIVVTFNYRIDVFGFLYLSNSEAPGNMGLLDQVLAMQWVKDNIRAFGGDENRVTLFGQSAGSTSVYYHYLSPMSRDLFNRGIMMSGTPQRYMVHNKKSVAQNMTLQLAEKFGCPVLGDREGILNCLRAVSAEDLITVFLNVPQGPLLPAFRPIVDGFFIKECPQNLFQRGLFQKSEMIVGNANDDGSEFLTVISSEFLVLPGNIPQTTKESFREELMKADKETPPILLQKSSDFYFKNGQNNAENIDSAIRMVTNTVFICPAKEQQKWASAAGVPVYAYLWKVRAQNIGFPNWMGIYHGSEIGFLFGLPFQFTDVYTEEERELSKSLIQYFTQFAKTGNPNWSQYTPTGKEYLVFDINGTSIGKDLRADECQFWSKNFISEIGSMVNSTEESCTFS